MADVYELKDVHEFLTKCKTYYFATVDGKKPRVRPFGTCLVYEGRIYFQIGKSKDVFRQLEANPEIEICAYDGGHAWVRIEATAVLDDRTKVRQAMLDAFPGLKAKYAADDGTTQVFFLSAATAYFYSFTEEHEVVHEKTVNFPE
jgi:uncharacterized pyridoxamine 5'-phosphate oxidase family protein